MPDIWKIRCLRAYYGFKAEVGLSISWEDAYVELHDEENEKKIETYKVDALTQFMDSLQNHFLVSVSPEQLQPLKLYYQLDYAQKSGQTAFYLRLYVNNGKRNYLIKNIHEFLNKCFYTDHYKLTPKVSIAVAPECFSKRGLCVDSMVDGYSFRTFKLCRLSRT